MLSVIAAVLSPGSAQSASPPQIRVTARVYNAARVLPAARQDALDVATRALASATVTVAWTNCESGCPDVPTPGELIVRLVRSGDAPQTEYVVLGEAFIDVRVRAGVLATIYVDQVERLATASGADMTTLLGRAIAHEVGHLLLATNRHSPSGLMRAKWSREDLQRDRPVDWLFTPGDAQDMRRR
jgi:hypothetical protein